MTYTLIWVIGVTCITTLADMLNVFLFILKKYWDETGILGLKVPRSECPTFM